jgi:hypothetical protein
MTWRLHNVRRDLLVVALAVLAMVCYAQPLVPENQKGPDSLVNEFFALRYAETGSMRHTDEAFEAAGEWARPRGTAVVDGWIVPIKFVGFPMVAGPLASVVGEDILWLVPVAGGLAALGVGVLAEAAFGRGASLAAVPIALATSLLWFWSGVPFTDAVVGSAFVVTGIGFFLHALGSPAAGRDLRRVYDPVLATWGSLLIGTGLAVRPDAILFVWPFAALGAWAVAGWPWRHWGGLLAGLAPLAVFAALNARLYGAPWRTGTHVKKGSEEVTFSVFEDASHFIPNLFDVLSAYPMLPMALLGLAFVLLAWRPQGRRAPPAGVLLAMASFAGIASFVMFYLGGRIHPTRHGLDRSLTRYLLVGFLLALPGFIGLMRAVPRQLSLVGVVLAMALGVASMPLTAGSIELNDNTREHFMDVRAFVLRQTPGEAVVVVGDEDKVLYPERQVVPMKNMPEGEEAALAAATARDLVAQGFDVYFLQNRFVTARSFEALLDPAGLQLTEVAEGAGQTLWRIESKAAEATA